MSVDSLAQLWEHVVDPYAEVLAYEYLYSLRGSSLSTISKLTVEHDILPTEALSEVIVLNDEYRQIKDYIDSKLGNFNVAIDNTPQYPGKLHVANYRVPLVYYSGDITLAERTSVSVVGARKASDAGKARAARLARMLVERGCTVVSGLAAGIDTAALRSAVKYGGDVIALIGTPLDEYYPRENRFLQDMISYHHLLMSQVPFYRYSKQPFKSKKVYFRERNVTMAAVSDATVIVEASDTSGSLIQARACIQQGRPLFIMKSCLDNSEISWPARFVEQGAIVLDEPNVLFKELNL